MGTLISGINSPQGKESLKGVNMTVYIVVSGFDNEDENIVSVHHTVAGAVAVVYDTLANTACTSCRYIVSEVLE